MQQDSWSLTRPKFGKDERLEVIGWQGRTKSGNKLYVVRCSVCSKDYELFGESAFTITKGNLFRGTYPCGCSSSVKWSKDQWKVLAQRRAKELGLEFICLNEDFHGCETGITLECRVHGIWHTKTLEYLICHSTGCFTCAHERRAISSTKPDEDMINSFISTGAFHKDSVFYRINRETQAGRKKYWAVLCPECGQYGESLSSNLQLGQRPCGCSRSRQQEAYINFVFIEGQIVAVKFGIANNTKSRLIQQNRNNPNAYIENYRVYKFESRNQCVSAERDCKNMLPTGILNKEQLIDGWSETVDISYLDEIIKIYENNGGIEIGKTSC